MGNRFSEIDPKVSIIITCFNYGRFLSDAIESALHQTLKGAEIIVVNDGSTDNTAKIAARYPVIQVHQNNQGLPTARNVGISNSKGVYILPLDADDKLHPQYLEHTVPILDRYDDTGVVYTSRLHFGLLNTVKQAQAFDLEMLKNKCLLNYCSLYRKQVWTECGGYDPKMISGYEDWDFWLNVAKRGWQFRPVYEALLLYRKHGYSLSDLAKDNHETLFSQITCKHSDPSSLSDFPPHVVR